MPSLPCFRSSPTSTGLTRSREITCLVCFLTPASRVGSRLNSIFFLVGCPCSLLFSFFADSQNKKPIFIGISLACHMSSFLLQFCSSYTVLYCWRGLSGALITSTMPIFLSILGDIFPSSLRSIASVISSVVVGCGMLLGQTISGFLSAHFGWRFFFRIVSAVGILATCSLFCVSRCAALRIDIRFPSKGEADGMKQVAKDDTEPLKSRDSEINEEVLEESMELEAETIRSDASILKYVFTIPSNMMRAIACRV